MARRAAALCLSALSACAAAPLDAWTHSWDTLGAAQFADFGYQPYTDADAAFLASHYAGVSVEKCSSPNATEEVVWANARLVKAHNPKTRVVFYFDIDMQALKCYAAHAVFMANPSWCVHHATLARCARNCDPSDPNSRPYARPTTLNHQVAARRRGRRRERVGGAAHHGLLQPRGARVVGVGAARRRGLAAGAVD